MGCGLKEGPSIDDHSMKKVEVQQDARKKKIIKTRSRHSIISPLFVGFTIVVYDGREHVSVYIRKGMVGHKLGELTLTRTYCGHVANGKKTKH